MMTMEPKEMSDYQVQEQRDLQQIKQLNLKKMSQMETNDIQDKGTEITDLDSLIKELHRIYEDDHINIEEVKEVLSKYKSNPADWRKFAKFDPLRYTRNLVDEGNGKFNLIALCWGEGQSSAVHDHSDSHCFVKMLDGQLLETMYDWPSHEDGDDEEGGEMKPWKESLYERDQVTYINDSMGLHRMSNPSHSHKTVSLHLYSPPFQTCQVFDERTGKTAVSKVTFWSKYGKMPYANETEINEISKVTIK